MKQQKILCIGGTNVDWTSLSDTEVFPMEGSTFEFNQSLGGVAYNIAQNLKSLDFDVGMMSVIGNDAEGKQFMNDMEVSGIDSTCMVMLKNQRTASIVFVIGRCGKVLLAWPRTEIYDVFTPVCFEPMQHQMNTYSAWVVDTDLCVESIEYIARNKPKSVPLYAVIACTPKSYRIQTVLGTLDGLFLNQEEASALFNRDLKTIKDISKAASDVFDQGVKHVFITMGEQGVCVHTDSFQGVFPAYKSDSRDTKGAGDAFATGVIAGLIENKPLDLCIRQGLAAASLVIEFHNQTYGMLNEHVLEKRRKLG